MDYEPRKLFHKLINNMNFQNDISESLNFDIEQRKIKFSNLNLLETSKESEKKDKIKESNKEKIKEKNKEKFQDFFFEIDKKNLNQNHDFKSSNIDSLKLSKNIYEDSELKE